MKIWQIVGAVSLDFPPHVRMQFRDKERAEKALIDIKETWRIQEVDIDDEGGKHETTAS